MEIKIYPKSLTIVSAFLILSLEIFSQAPPVTSIGTASHAAGTYSVPVMVTGFNNVGNLSLSLNYNTAELVYTGVSLNSGLLPANAVITPVSDQSGLFRLSYVSGSSITLASPGNTLLTLTFTARTGVQDIRSPLTWSRSQGACDMTPPSPGVFSPPITMANMSTYFIDGFINIGTVPVISGNSTVCEGSTGNVYTTQSGMTNYAWSVSAGGTITAGGTYLDNTVTVTWNTAGNQSVSVNFTSSGVTFPDPAVYPVTVNPSPPAAVNIAASPAGPVCTGTSVTFTAFPTNGGTPAYQWLKGGAVIPGATGPTYTSASLKNQDIISVRMTSSLSCVTGSPATSNAITMVVITSGKASVSIAASPSGAICSGTSVTFTATPVNGGTPAYQWFKGFLPITGATGPDYTSSTLKTGDIIWVRMTSSLPCVTGNPARSNAIFMVVYQCNPIILKTKVTDIHCSGAKPGAIDLTVTGGKAPYTYLWSNGATSQDLTNIKTAGTYKVRVTDSNGKTAEASASVKVISGPDAVIMPPDYINPVCGDFGTNILKAAPDGNYNFTYKWTVTAAGWSIKGPDNSREIRFIASTGEATFTLKVTDEFGCEDIATYVMAGCNPENYCTYTKDFYGKKNGNACDPEGNPISPKEIMIRAFGSGSSVNFGAQPGEKGFKFVLRINEVQSDFIFNMLPGGGSPNALKGNANSDPDRRTGWNYVPISTSRSSFGQIKNNLLVQTMTLFFNLSNEPALNQVRITGKIRGYSCRLGLRFSLRRTGNHQIYGDSIKCSELSEREEYNR